MKASESYTPIYQRLFEQYRDAIVAYELKPGERIDSISAMQHKHGVGRETAKRVLKQLEEEGFIVQRQGKGSYVRDLGPKEPIWGLVFPFNSLQYEELIFGIAAQAEAQGREFRHFCTFNRYEEEVQLVGRMLQDHYEAVIVIPTLDESRAWQSFYCRLPADDSTIILLDHTMTNNNFPFVIQSYDLGVTRAMNHLLATHPGGIAFVENEFWPGRNMVLELMRGTYMETLRKKRPEAEPLIFQRAKTLRYSDLRAKGITGVFCCDDVSAIQVIGQLKEQGASIPGNIGVVSYGNTELSRFFTPPISSVDPCNLDITEALGKLLLQRQQDPRTPPQQLVVQPRLIVRET